MGPRTLTVADFVSVWRNTVFNPRVGRIDAWLVGSVAGLCVLGLVMVWSASHLTGELDWGDPHRFVSKQFGALVLGALGMYAASRLRIRWIERHLGWLLGFVILLLVLVLGFGIVAGGAPRWLSLWGFMFQPSELAKLAVVLYVARALATDSGRAANVLARFGRPLLVAGLVAGLIILQRDLSTALVVCGVTALMLFVGGVRLSHLAVVALAAVAIGALGVQDETYRSERVQAWLNPEEHREGKGWQLWQSQIAFASGGVTGTGLGKGEQKTGRLPAVHTDFIYSLVGEEFGVVGAMAILLLFGCIGFRGFLIAARHPDPFSSFLAFGITALLLTQAALHVGVTIGLFPTTGLVLPFLSYGGSALVVMLVEIGILGAVSRMNG